MLSNEIELESFVEEKIMELMNLTLKGLEFNPNGPLKCLTSLSRDNIPPSLNTSNVWLNGSLVVALGDCHSFLEFDVFGLSEGDLLC